MTDGSWHSQYATGSPSYDQSISSDSVSPPTKRQRLSSPINFIGTDYDPSLHMGFASPVTDTSDSIFPSGEKQKRPKPNSDGYHCKVCHSLFRTESDYKKDQARHDRPYKCSFSGCPHQERGFSTVNDLNRHLKAVHGVKVAGTKDYKCLVAGCSKVDRTWPRLDNFRQHVIRMHPDSNVDEVVLDSEQWFEATASMPRYVVASTYQATTKKLRLSRNPNSAISTHSPRNHRSRTTGGSKGGRPLPPHHTSRRLSFSSAPPSADVSHLQDPTQDYREIATEGNRTPTFRPANAFTGFTTNPVERPSPDWLPYHQDHGTMILGSGLADSYPDAGPDPILVEQTPGFVDSTLLPIQVPQIILSPPSGILTQKADHNQTNNHASGMDGTVTAQLQSILADHYPAAGDTFQITSEYEPENDNIPADGCDSGHGSSSPFSASVQRNSDRPGDAASWRKLGSRALGGDNHDDGNDGTLPRILRVGQLRMSRPRRYFACPFHVHDPVTYASCQNYRVQTVDTMYADHVMIYHVQHGHINETTLASLNDPSRQQQRSPVHRWFAIYHEIFNGRNASSPTSSPSPFWMPCLSSTNLDDLVRATVQLSGRDMTALQDVHSEEPSLAPFHRRVDRIQQLTAQAEKLELQQVRRRWRMVEQQSFDRLATNSNFRPSVLQEFTGSPDQHRVANATMPASQAQVHIADSPDPLNTGGHHAGYLETEFPSPPVALPASAFCMTSVERAQSRQSTPNDTGYESNACRWMPQKEDPALCHLCWKTKDLHEADVIDRGWEHRVRSL